jgi:hypothetical protein
MPAVRRKSAESAFPGAAPVDRREHGLNRCLLDENRVVNKGGEELSGIGIRVAASKQTALGQPVEHVLHACSFGLGAQKPLGKMQYVNGEIGQLRPSRARELCPGCSIFGRHATKGKAVRLIVGDQHTPLAVSTLAILKAIARARKWRDQIIAGEATGIRDLARIHKLNHSYVKRIYSFASFGPVFMKQFSTARSLRVSRSTP